MVSSARVRLWGRSVGVAIWHPESGYAEFEFDKEFLNSGLDVAPIKMTIQEAQNLPTGQAGGTRIFSFPQLNPETFRGLPGLLADSLPDRFGDRIMEAWLQKQGRDLSDLNPVERLCYTGKRGMGALEFEPVQHTFEQKSELLQVDELVQLARSVMNERSTLKTNLKDDDALMDILRVGTSAGGARAKAIIAFNERTGEVRSGQVDGLEGFSYWLIKFDGVQSAKLGDPMGYGRIEYAYHKMALTAGIEMAPCRLLEEGKRAHFMTKRFDRQLDTDTGKVEKLHMQTLCGIAHFDYNDPTAYSYEQAFKVMRQLALPYPDAEQLFRRMCFNVMARNQDDHTKNISFLMDKNGIWSLAPAYDMTYAFDPLNKWLKVHQMSVNGKREGIERYDLLAVAKSMNIKKAEKLIAEVAQAVENWNAFAESAEVEATQIAAIKRVLRLDLS